MKHYQVQIKIMGWCTLSIKVNEKEVFAIHLEDKDIQKVYWNEHILFEANKFERV